ncbi:MAG: phage tail tape measure protein [Defluviitoga sp.]
MALNVGNLVANLDLNTQGFRKGIAESQQGVKGIKDRFSALKPAVIAGAASIGAAFAAIGAAAFSAANSIDEAMANIRVGTGATGEDLVELGDNLRSVLQKVPADAETVGTAIADLNTRLGLTGEKLEDTALEFVELSRITGTDVATNIKTVTRLFGDFGVATEDQGDALNYLFKVSQATGATVDELAKKAAAYGTSLRGMGFDMETSIALLGKFEKEGVNTETILASLKIGMANMAREGVTDANEALTLLMAEIKDAPTDVDATRKAIETFGSRAGPDMALAIREGRFEVNDLIDSVESSSETILKAADDSKTLGDRVGILKNKITVAIEPLGEMIISALEGAVEWLSTDGAEMFAPVLAAFSAVAAWWETAGAAIFSAIGGAFEWLQGVMQPFIDMYVGFWGEQAQKMTEFWETDGKIVMAALENVRAAFQVVIEYIARGWAWLWAHLENILGPAIDVLLDIFGVFSALLAGDWERLGERLVMIPLHVMDAIYGVAALGFDAITALFGGFAEGVVGIMAAAWNAVLGGLEGMINAATGLLNGLIEQINKIPGVNIGMVGQVQFERAEAPKLDLPTMAQLLGGKKPSEIIGEELGLDLGGPQVAEEEEMIVPERGPVTAGRGATAREPAPITAPEVIPIESVAPIETVSVAEEEELAPPVQETLSAGNKQQTVAIKSLGETVKSVGSAIVSAIETSFEKADLDFEAYRNSADFPGIISGIENLKTELITVIQMPTAQVTAAPAVIPPENQAQDIHITTEIDGYAVGQAIYKNWSQRTGGGVNI